MKGDESKRPGRITDNPEMGLESGTTGAENTFSKKEPSREELSNQDSDNDEFGEKAFNKDVDIYDDDVAVTAVGALIGDAGKPDGVPEKASEMDTQDAMDINGDMDMDNEREIIPGKEKVVPEDESKEEKSEKVYREYIVREFFSDQDDPTAEDADRNLTDGDIPEDESETAEPEDEEDGYMDYIHITSRQLAEERSRRKGRDGKVGNGRDTGYVRDASRNPAVRKEREREVIDKGDAATKPALQEGEEQNTGRRPAREAEPDMERTHETDRTRETEHAHDTERPRGTERPAERTGDTERPRGTERPRETAPERKRTRETAVDVNTGRVVSTRPVTGRYTVPTPQSTGRTPVKSPVPSRRNDFFDVEKKNADNSADVWYPQITAPRIIMACAAVVILGLIAYLLITNRSLSNRLSEANERVAQNASYAADEYQLLKQQYDSKVVELDELKSKNENDNLAHNTETPAPPVDTQSPQTTPDTGVTGVNPPIPPAVTPSIVEYVVKAGDTLSKISSAYYGTDTRWREIYDYNNLTSENLSIGQLLRIPMR